MVFVDFKKQGRKITPNNLVALLQHGIRICDDDFVRNHPEAHPYMCKDSLRFQTAQGARTVAAKSSDQTNHH